jgi:hypothetical protein
MLPNDIYYLFIFAQKKKMAATTQSVPAATKPKPGAEPTEEVSFHRIRITLSSRNVKSLEKGKLYISHFC